MHTPVLLKEVIQAFEPVNGKKIIDATANGGGHTNALRELGARVLPIELDPELAKITGAVNANYAEIEKIANGEKFDGVLFDLGFSSWHVDQSGRGFSFQRDEPLDMRYSGEGETAAELINRLSEDELARILREYGQERYDGRIAHAIVKHRPIYTTFQLCGAIESVVKRRGRINPATRTFQALRIAVNHEFENLEKGLAGALNVLKDGGVLAVITFHTLEERIVKKFIKNKPISPTFEEIKINRRARSAKLRILIK